MNETKLLYNNVTITCGMYWVYFGSFSKHFINLISFSSNSPNFSEI